MAWWKNLEGLGVMFEAVYNFSFDNFPQTAQESYRAVGCGVSVVRFARFPKDDCFRHLPSSGKKRGEKARVGEVTEGLAQARSAGLDSTVWDLVSTWGFVRLKTGDDRVHVKLSEQGGAGALRWEW